ncbi:uncharacterized protein LOC108680745 isoform X2 [Hyalella azteca]|uniref:Uncharacterized protein LOC108680745 isoform X2 n=1 Tax=Hyalella azteca TaxID=294128 RepID=A0A8B7PIG2_HYAAZ|nr:uncharacterized protein LOC108680745 isoform X2 [Hyalella azteca]
MPPLIEEDNKAKQPSLKFLRLPFKKKKSFSVIDPKPEHVVIDIASNPSHSSSTAISSQTTPLATPPQAPKNIGNKLLPNFIALPFPLPTSSPSKETSLTDDMVTNNEQTKEESTVTSPIFNGAAISETPSSPSSPNISSKFKMKTKEDNEKKTPFLSPAYTNLGFQGDSESTLGLSSNCSELSVSSSEDDTWEASNTIISADTGISSAAADDSDSSGLFIAAKTNREAHDRARTTLKHPDLQTSTSNEDVKSPPPESCLGWKLFQNQNSMPNSLSALNQFSSECNRSTGNLSADHVSRDYQRSTGNLSVSRLPRECHRSTGNLSVSRLTRDSDRRTANARLGVFQSELKKCNSNQSVISDIKSESHLRLYERNTRKAYSRQLRVMWAERSQMSRSTSDLRFLRCSESDAKSPNDAGSLSETTTSFLRMSKSSNCLSALSADGQPSVSQTSSSTCIEQGCTDKTSPKNAKFASDATPSSRTESKGSSSAAYQRRYKRARSAPPRSLFQTPLKPVTARWVGEEVSSHRGAHGNSGTTVENGAAGGASFSLPSTPVTPHIVVSLDEDSPDDTPEDEEEFRDDGAEKSSDENNRPHMLVKSKSLGSCENLDGSKSEFNGPTSAERDQLARHNSISSYLSPEVEVNLQRKTRRSSMIGLMHHAASMSNVNSLNVGQPLALPHATSSGSLRHGASRNSLAPSNGDWRREGKDSMISGLSALYGKILVVMGLAFPIGEFISGEMPLYVYKGFYLYLHLGSIIFLVYAYMFLLQVVPLPKVEIKSRLQNLNRGRLSAKTDVERSGGGRNDDSRSMNTTMTFNNNKNYTITESTHESMYLKMGAMVFGIGSMIYSGLEVGQYFDLKATAECADLLMVVSPLSRMLFTFIQMYFIFLNSRVAINKHRTVARFGLMHMIATNLCIWLNVLVEETKHEIHSITHANSGHGDGHHGDKLEDDELYGHGLATVMTQIADAAKNMTHHSVLTTTHGPDVSSVLPDFMDSGSSEEHHAFLDDVHDVVRRSADTSHSSSIYDCRKSDMMSRLVDNASPFLFPCTIEYSLLCSGVLYVIWKNINKSQSGQSGNCGDSDISTFIARKARHHYSVDCAHATRGLFMGILVLVLTIISLILFFVLINNENTKSVAVLEANVIELSVYSVAIITVVIGMIQMRELEFVEHEDLELDNILLLIAQTGTYIYTCFTIIGGNFSLDAQRALPFFTAVITLVQTTLQTLFILNASRRCCYTYDQLNRKPGREMVTFLLICNLAMWAISTFETSRADAHPTLLNYYGVWAWTIISHVSMPLAIFYRFHVTVCLCEIWKRSYKLKHDFL